jgi:lipopolysaccharide/colanic/teichoic acid biosynthesis glycosyltransferase
VRGAATGKGVRMPLGGPPQSDNAVLIRPRRFDRESQPQADAGPADYRGKRIFDFAVAAMALLLLLPWLTLLALLVGLTSKGPLIYACRVAGRLGRPFTLYKFRTMVPGASLEKANLSEFNEADWPMFKMRGDPRVTAFGRFLRKHSLDELPQLWNVLQGEMSLVGPRPVLLEEWEHFTPWQKRKLAIQPGAICLWHLRGQPRNLEDWIRLDLEYQRVRSFGLDLRILLQGLGFMLRGQNY